MAAPSLPGLQPSVKLLSPVQGNPRGLAFDGTYMYITNFGQPDSIYKFRRDNPQVVDTIKHNLGEVGSLAWDWSNGTIWAGDYNADDNQTVYNLNPNLDWKVEAHFSLPYVNTYYGGIDGLTYNTPQKLDRGLRWMLACRNL